jgi:hypothetical protein
MSHLRARFTLAALVLLLALASGSPIHAQQRLPDSTLFTQYSNFQPTEVSWLTCGSLPLTEGCYGSGELSPFVNACSVVQSVPAALNPFTVVRYIYVLDSGSSAGGVTLTAFKRTDTVNQSEDTISITTVASVPLPMLTGGTSVNCMMSQNPTGVFASTSQSSSGVIVNKSSYAVSQIGGSVSSITADSYGYVIVDQGVSGGHVFTTYGPNSEPEEDGGGDYYMINPINGMTPANYPSPAGAMRPKVGWWPKSEVPAQK